MLVAGFLLTILWRRTGLGIELVARAASSKIVRRKATMNFLSRFTYIPAVMIVCAGVTGCFSYHKTVEPAPAPAVVEMSPPVTTSSTTTTTSDNGLVQRQKTTTYSVNP
jgi:hypothetical protein